MTEAQGDKKRGRDNLPIRGCPEQHSKINISSLTHHHHADQACATVLLMKQNNPGRKEPVKTSRCFMPMFWQDWTNRSPREESRVTLSPLLGSQPLAQVRENKLKEPTKTFQK